MVAIGFFAVWCILSNMVATVILFITHPFKVDDRIVLLPEDIHGAVSDFYLMFIILKDEFGNKKHIPNNIFFQRIVKNLGPAFKNSDPREKSPSS